MIALEVFGESALLERVASTLDQTDGVSHVAHIDATRPGYALVSARVRPRSVDALLDTLHGLGVADSNVTLDRIEVVGALSRGRAERTMVWADVLGTAWLNARPLARYLAFMVVAGVIASYGVVDNNGILIVGAMAVSPDLLADHGDRRGHRRSPGGARQPRAAHACAGTGGGRSGRGRSRRSSRITWASYRPATTFGQPGC